MNKPFNIRRFFLIANLSFFIYFEILNIPFQLMIMLGSNTSLLLGLQEWLEGNFLLLVITWFILNVWLFFGVNQYQYKGKSFKSTLAKPSIFIIPFLVIGINILGLVDALLVNTTLRILPGGLAALGWLAFLAWYSIPVTLTMFTLASIFSKKT